MTTDTSKLPSLVDKSVRKVWIKDGRRRLMTDSGFMLAPQEYMRRMFGRLRGGKYSEVQHARNKS